MASRPTRLQKTRSYSMDMLEIHELQIIVDRIMGQTMKDSDCDLWINTVNTSAERSTRRQPRIRVGGRNGKPVRCIDYLWQYHHGEPIPDMINHDCDNGGFCLNINHKSRWVAKPRVTKTEYRRRFARHTNECGGIDPVVIDMIVQAGTVNAMPKNTYICDCERAYILKYVPNAYNMIGRPSTRTRQYLYTLPV